VARDRKKSIYDLVGTRRFCFVIMPYEAMGLFYEHLRQVIEDATGLRCIRADEVPGSGQSLLEKLHTLIECAELVVAELSGKSPNVFYEVGYAKAKDKEVLAICPRGTEIPTDLKGLERIEYVDTPSELPAFDRQLRQHLVTMVDSDIRLLRAMLVAPDSSPSYILCSPRWDTARTTEGSGERRTYGDYLGVVGVVHTLGALLGNEGIPELVSARHLADELLHLREDCNAYLIGSPLANDAVEAAMANLQPNVKDPWKFEMTEGYSTLCGYRDGDAWRCEADHSVAHPEKDYGIILRGPHPNPAYAGRLVVVMAGARSLGTGAACLAATRPELIQEIRNRLPESDLEDKTQTFWALVCGRPDAKDGHVSAETVTVEDAGVIQ